MGRCAEGCHKFGRFIYNPSKNSFFGRTCKSWALIFIYFLVFYTCLAGFFTGMLSVLIYGLLSNTVPSLTGMQSLLKLNPGLGYLPRVDVDRPLLQVSTFDSYTRKWYLNATEEFLKNYGNSRNCDLSKPLPPSGDVRDVCRFPKSLLGPCADPKSVLEQDNICIYVKLNKVYGWLPDINGTEITIRCGPANSFDGELLGEPEYHPSAKGNNSMGAFSSIFFPYINQENYESPLVAVTFPKLTKNTLVMIECSLVNVGYHDEQFRLDLSLDTIPPP
nr:unnamed protein product [Spirometra erinaceieuropaei]